MASNERDIGLGPMVEFDAVADMRAFDRLGPRTRRAIAGARYKFAAGNFLNALRGMDAPPADDWVDKRAATMVRESDDQVAAAERARRS